MNTIGVGREPISKHMSYPMRSGNGRPAPRAARGCIGIVNDSGIDRSLITANPLDGNSHTFHHDSVIRSAEETPAWGRKLRDR
jgi:hypothetical protein